jgi:hypothetical protein
MEWSCCKPAGQSVRKAAGKIWGRRRYGGRGGRGSNGVGRSLGIVLTSIFIFFLKILDIIIIL